MDYEIYWREDSALAARLKLMKKRSPNAPFGFHWVGGHVLTYGFERKSTRVCDVLGDRPTPKQRKAIENLARARYGL